MGRTTQKNPKTTSFVKAGHPHVTWLSEVVEVGCQINYDNLCNLILKNGQPSMYLFDGGYATFNANGAVNGWHYYIQDYMGNNRMVVNKNGTKEQVTHYYPYGGVIGDISTNENVQKYKFEGKELDRTFGLDNYDIHARQYFAMMPSWDRIDKKAEDYYHLSPYSYCGGDPVNKVDYNGLSYTVDTLGYIKYDDDGIDKLFGTSPNGEESMALNKTQISVLKYIIEDQINAKKAGEKENSTTIDRNKNGKISVLTLYKFLAYCTSTEWAITAMNRKGGFTFILQANHDYPEDSYIGGHVSLPFEDLRIVDFHIHSHGRFDGTSGPSGRSELSSTGDYAVAQTLYRNSNYIEGLHSNVSSTFYKLYVYSRYSNTLYKYNIWEKYTRETSFSTLF